MRGIISFILLLFLIESFVAILIINSYEFENSSDKILHSVKLLDFYEVKIKMKRELQNILISGSNINDPEKRILFVSKQLELYELTKETNLDYDIDLWCGYINSANVYSMLITNEKPVSVQDMNSKIIMDDKEIYFSSTVLIYDNELNNVKVGRNYGTEYYDLIPAIGFTIKSKDGSFFDVDYIGVLE